VSDTPDEVAAPEQFEAATTDGEKWVEFGGRKIRFPDKLPTNLAPALQMRRTDLVYRILGRDDADAVDWLIVHMPLEFIDDGLPQLYGLNEGESNASAG
jgi:hypothetical protein